MSIVNSVVQVTSETNWMRLLKKVMLAAMLAIPLTGCESPPAVTIYAPEDTLHANGMLASPLRDAVNFAMANQHKTKGIVVQRYGQVLAEAYDSEESQTGKHLSFSVAKSFSSALVGIAIDEGLLSLDDSVCQFFDEWDCNDENDARRHIQLRHILTLTTGLKWHEDWSCPMNRLRLAFRQSDAVYMDIALLKTPPSYVLSRPSEHPAGEQFNYSTGDTALLSRIIEKVTGMGFLEFAQTRLFTPLGITEVEWKTDANGNVRNYSHLHLRTKDFAKLGQLYLQQGRWQDKQIVSEQWVRASTDPKAGITPWYAYLWHVDLPVKYQRPTSSIPRDAFMARGIFGQWIVVVPSLDLVIAKNGNDQCSVDEPLLIEKIIAAVRDR